MEALIFALILIATLTPFVVRDVIRYRRLPRTEVEKIAPEIGFTGFTTIRDVPTGDGRTTEPPKEQVEQVELVTIEADADPLTRQLAETRDRLAARRPPPPPRTTEQVAPKKPAEAPSVPAQSRQEAPSAVGAQPPPEAGSTPEAAPERPIRVVRPTGSVIAEGQAAVDWLIERGANAARLRSAVEAEVPGVDLADVAGIVKINFEGGVLCLTYNPDPPPARAPERPATQQRKAAPKAIPQGKGPSNPDDPTDPTSPAFLKWNDPRRLAMEAGDE